MADSSTDQDLAKQAYVLEHSSLNVSFEADGSGVKEWTAQVKVLADAGVQKLAVLNFTYASANETLDFEYVRVRKPDGKLVITPDYNIQDMAADVTRSAPMYSDIHEKHVAVKGLAVGDTLEYQLRYRITKPTIPGQFWLEYSFNTDALVRDETVEISFPASKTVKVYSPEFTPTIQEENARKIYRWQNSNLKLEDAAAETAQQEIPPSIEVSTFATWREIGSWYAGLQHEAVQPTSEIKTKAAEITKDLTTDEDKVRAIYSFVSLQVHYVGLDFGIGRFQPHSAEDVLENRYGDCKDKHTLLAALLNAAGYRAFPVLINANKKLRVEVPSPAQFNHVITFVPLADKHYWLDTTPEVAPFGLLMPALRDKDALVISEEKGSELSRTPAEPPFRDQQVFEAVGKLSSDDVFTGHMKANFRGDFEVVLRSAFRNSPEANWTKLAQQISGLMNFAGEVSNVKISSPSDTTQPFELSYDYVRKEYGDWANRQITPPLPPVGIEFVAYDTKPRKDPYKFNERTELTYSASVELPKGAQLAELPKTENVQPFAEYHSSTRFSGGVLTTERRFVVKQTEVAVKDWEALRKFAKTVSDDENTFVKIGGLGEDTTQIAAGDESPARTPLQRGIEALRRSDNVSAQEIFEQVLADDPKCRGAHFYLGAAYQAQGRLHEALGNYHKEEEVAGDDERPYAAAAMLESFLGERAEAIADWEKLAKADPKNHDAPLHLADLYLEEGKSHEAVTALEAAVGTSSDSATLNLELGFAYLKAGEAHAAMPFLQKAASSSANLAQADVARLDRTVVALVDTNSDLQTAQTLCDQALAKAEQDSRNSAHDSVPSDAPYTLAETWNAAGWLAFRKRDFVRAESYARASWLLGENPEAGYHLGQIYEQQGKTRQALHQYALTMAAADAASVPFGLSDPESSAKSSRQRAHERYLKLAGKEPSLNATDRLPNGKWTTSPVEELSRMHQVKLSPTAPVSGSAEFFLIFQPGGLESARFLRGDDGLKAESESLRTAHYQVIFPNVSNATIVWRAIVSCHPAEGCNAMLVPLGRGRKHF